MFVWTNFLNFSLQQTYARRNLQLFQQSSPPPISKKEAFLVFFLFHIVVGITIEPIFENYLCRGEIFKLDSFLNTSPPPLPPKPPRRKSQRSKNLCITVLFNFCFNIFFVNDFLKKLFPKNQNLIPLAPKKGSKYAWILWKFGNIEAPTPQYLYKKFPLFVNFDWV